MSTKYKDTKWPADSPIAGEMLAANGIYTGQHKGAPMQDAKAEDETANTDPYDTEHKTIHFGTITPDAADDNFPAVDNETEPVQPSNEGEVTV